MALASLDVIRHLDQRLTLAVLISRLAEKRAAALAIVGNADEDALNRAEELAFPLIELPPATSLYELEQVITHSIYERRAQLYQQGAEIHRQLVELSIVGRGLAAIVERLAEMTGRAAVLQSGTFEVEHLACPADQGSTRDEIVASLPHGETVLAELRGQPLFASNPPVLRLIGHGVGVLVAPIAVGQQAVGGYLYLIGPDDSLDDADRVALARASVVCALELAKQHAVVQAEQRLRGDFLEELLQGRSSEEVLLSRARHLGYDLSRPHTVLVIEPALAAERAGPGSPAGSGLDELAASARRYLAGQKVAAPVMARDRCLVALCPLPNPPDLTPARELARKLLEHLGESRGLSVGIGRYRPGLSGLRSAYHEAEQSVIIGRHLFGVGQVTCFADLGVYRVLFALKDNPDLADFCHENLSALLEYDAKNGTELLRTADAFFAHRANLQATANALFLHRNSLAYRLRRIEEVSGLDLDDFEDRFRLQLALKARQILTRPGPSGGST
mgnify:CR=1 FL=1